MQVFELLLQICFSRPQHYERVSEQIGRFLDAALGRTERYRRFHVSHDFKSYTFDLPYPLESEHIYRQEKIYAIRIRTIQEPLAAYFVKVLPTHEAVGIQGLSGELRILPRCSLGRVYTLTPVVMKTRQGYWRGNLRPAEYEARLRDNLIRKYNFFHHTELPGDLSLYQKMEFRNRKPVKIPCKNVVLLGDKISMTASGSAMAQEVLYMALGTGVGENNARGCGFLHYRIG